MADQRQEPLRVRIEDGRLIISIGVDTLSWALEHGGPFEELDEDSGDYHNPKVTDSDVWAKEVLRTLEREEEDGTTPVHELLDSAMQRAIDDGADGVAFRGDPEWTAPKDPH